jgi:predicted ATPase
VDWNRERLTTRIALKRFGPAQTREQLMALMCEKASPPPSPTPIHRETEGNPFFVEEVLKASDRQGSVRRDRTGWTRDDLKGPGHIRRA